jgi:hypothetical protein
MFDRHQKIMDKIKTLPKGSFSSSGRYWCVTCKKLFRIGEPVCPYMTDMCVNSPITLENFVPESSEWLERMALFYPKIPQRVMGALLKENPAPLGKSLAEAYMDFLAEWKIEHRGQPLQTIRSFILILSGCETAQRVTESEITFIVIDSQKIWEEGILFPLLKDALDELKKRLGVRQDIKFDQMEIIGERDMGKYYCGRCRKFFEFGIEREKVTCPLMAQKCMFDPVNIKNIKYTVSDFIKVLKISPDIHSKFLSLIPEHKNGPTILREVLTSDWKFELTEPDLQEILQLLGLARRRPRGL